ncbi:hypothetical protein L1987_52508 [Smallanthus sonchifolius]|uniref:Uncharacterized protein n=1 Tax=Smallanthus sonchifolius TaxID=185202 RepID=A0ACB9ETM4_9ASTR|nr:hypothetical protein L1987_52508 [Smallanthus sonchifolius]
MLQGSIGIFLVPLHLGKIEKNSRSYRRKTNMGIQRLMLLVMILSSFCSLASCAPLNKNLVPESPHENMVNQSKYTTTLRGSGGGVRPTGDGGNGVVPVYAAGAAAQRRNHKGGAATYTPCRFAVVIATSSSLLLYILM